MLKFKFKNILAIAFHSSDRTNPETNHEPEGSKGRPSYRRVAWREHSWLARLWAHCASQNTFYWYSQVVALTRQKQQARKNKSAVPSAYRKACVTVKPHVWHLLSPSPVPCSVTRVINIAPCGAVDPDFLRQPCTCTPPVSQTTREISLDAERVAEISSHPVAYV